MEEPEDQSSRTMGGALEGPERPALANAFDLDVREQLLAMAEKVTNVGTFAWDLENDVIHWSEQLYVILGYDRSVKPSSEAFFARIHEDDAAWVREVSRRAVAAIEAEPVDFRVLRPDGSIRHIHMISQVASGASGRALRFVGALLDMTDRVEAEANLWRREQAFRRAQQIAKVGTFEWYPETGEAEWSEQIYRMCGVPFEVKGTPELYFSMVHPDDRDRITGIAAAVSLGDPIGPWEYRIVRTDGEIVDVFGEATPIFDHHGKPTGYVGTALDVTMRKRYEAQLLQAQKMEALGRLAGGIAHDFNNLLTVIGAHAASMKRRISDPSLDEISRAVERASDLTHRLLAFGRQAVLETRAVDPVRVVRESLGMIGRVVGDAISIELSTEGCTGKITAEPSQLDQVLLNLVINARDAIEGDGRIRVRLRDVRLDAPIFDVQPTVAPGDYVMLEVEDDGAGMPEAVKHRAIEPFFSTKGQGGTGLGLAMVYGIVSQYGGGLLIDSKPGEGTVVRLYFPRAQEVSSSAEPEPSQDAPPRAVDEDQKLVLVVDDEASVRRILGAVLEDAGYRVHLAAGGEEALAFYDATVDEVAAVVTDVMMPGMTGVDLVRALRERRPSLPALYLSGYAQVHGLDEADPTLRGSFLKKPFTAEELVARVEELFTTRTE